MSGENEVERALTLISHHLCPYVQRAAIALAEKSIAFERINIDLAAKPAWFKAVSPLGKVPVLRVTQAGGEETSIFESAVILEYLEETSPSPLHPGNALQRARHRGWIEFGSQVLNGIGRFYSATERATFERERAALEAMFARLEEELAEGPFFAGANFSLVDAVFAPVFRYFDGFEALGVLGILAGKPRVTAWRKALAARPSVKAAVVEDFQGRLLKFFEARKGVLVQGRLAA
jgi:glutathione S-transferase